MGKRFKCIVCGRVFPEGQGIVVVKSGLELAFHSSRCVSKFFKRLLENAPDELLSRVLRDVYEEFMEEIRAREERRAKKI